MEWLNLDSAYTVIALIVVTVIVLVAYGKGYSAGHDAGYVEAVNDINAARQRAQRHDRRRRN